MSMQRAYKFINKLGGDGIFDKNSFKYINYYFLFVIWLYVCEFVQIKKFWQRVYFGGVVVQKSQKLKNTSLWST